MSLTRIKQILMGIGLLTVLGTVALLSMVAYLWWDAGRQMEAVDVDAESEPSDIGADVDASE